MICNPPYGERLSDVTALPELFTQFGDVLRERFAGWRASIVAPNVELGFRTGLRLKKKNAARNGAIEVTLLTFDIPANSVPTNSVPANSAAAKSTAANRATDPASDSGARPQALDAHIDDFKNRIRKNHKRLTRWARQHDVTCFRVYDADLPDFAFAIDVYRNDALRLHVQEYAPPASVDVQRAQLRRDSVAAVLPELFDTDASHVFVKTRERKRGNDQYTRQDHAREFHRVEEGGCRLLVNLRDYLDTGLFLDHRPLRMRIQREAAGKTFLNLFAYTGAATVHAVRGGATSTTSVDLSNTYLDWALRNLELNTRDLRHHRFIRADCKAWLADAVSGHDRYDLILLDPPSFSNSKSTDEILDIQRDHVELIRACIDLLAHHGTLYFSTNMRSFKFDELALADLACLDITAETIDEDFRRSPRIHRCWQLTRRSAGE